MVLFTIYRINHHGMLLYLKTYKKGGNKMFIPYPMLIIFNQTYGKRNVKKLKRMITKASDWVSSHKMELLT